MTMLDGMGRNKSAASNATTVTAVPAPARESHALAIASMLKPITFSMRSFDNTIAAATDAISTAVRLMCEPLPNVLAQKIDSLFGSGRVVPIVRLQAEVFLLRDSN
jgi:hypothetical protein